MSKPYTEEDFTSQITQDRNWRIKEISDLKFAIQRGDTNLRKVLLRALVALCYAHWEGYVRFAAKKYLEHIALRKFPFEKLEKQFLTNYFLPRLSALANSKTSISERCQLIEDILEGGKSHFRRVNEELINTKSNLNFEVFSDVCLVCGLSTDLLRDKDTFIDIVLLKRRNAIAHGEETLVGLEELDDISSETIGIMRAFGDALENKVIEKSYKSA